MVGDEYVPLGQAQREWGISDHAFRRKITRGLLPVYTNPSDSRSRLVRRADLERLREPQPTEPIYRRPAALRRDRAEEAAAVA